MSPDQTDRAPRPVRDDGRRGSSGAPLSSRLIEFRPPALHCDIRGRVIPLTLRRAGGRERQTVSGFFCYAART